jgi:CMP-N,N'-diacetyllegionaminic acid synthase
VIEGKRILAIIPARGGSKGLSRKNLRELCGKPLIAWTIAAAQKSHYIDRLILSSEDEEIISIAQEWGCEVPFIRPQELAQDDTGGLEPVLHAIHYLEEQYDYVMLLQVTSPLRTTEDIDGCIAWCLEKKAKSCIGISEARESPYWMFHVESNDKLTPCIATDQEYRRRQDLPTTYMVNGALYIAETNWLVANQDFSSPDTIGYILPTERSIDVDCELDLVLCSVLLQKSNGRG